jgi:DNA-binding XRE family transcriptional regulator
MPMPTLQTEKSRDIASRDVASREPVSRDLSSRDLADVIRLERRAFAAKLRMARALIGLSQSDFGRQIGLTQRAIHKLEQGDTDPRRATARAIEQVWRTHGIDFEDTADGGFRVTVRPATFDRDASAGTRRERTGARSVDMPPAKRRPAA